MYTIEKRFWGNLRAFFLVAMSLLLGEKLSAQDILVTKQHEIIMAKVVSIDGTSVTYVDYPEGEIKKSIDSSMLIKINYASGFEQTFSGNTSDSGGPVIIRETMELAFKRGKYCSGNEVLDDNTLRAVLGEDDFKKAISKRNTANAGKWILLGSSIGFGVGGLGALSIDEKSGAFMAFAILMGTSIVVCWVGLGCWIFGGSSAQKLCKTYNINNGYAANISIGATKSGGFGLTYNF
ncbi:MAG: hypothetical protein IK008_07375 [Bacteroidales bacterium]|nr:hypothetical protein [Bacteroidales bacterium]